jgi:hypothetical protein
VRQGYEVALGDSYMMFEYWAITRPSQAEYACEFSLFDALD